MCSGNFNMCSGQYIVNIMYNITCKLYLNLHVKDFSRELHTKVFFLNKSFNTSNNIFIVF